MLFRVEVTGPELPRSISGLQWEGTQGQADGSQHHALLVESDSAQLAGARALDAFPLTGHSISAITQITAPPDWTGLNADREPDWGAITRRCGLTALQGELLDCLLNAGEPTWILDQECSLADRGTIEHALSDLTRQGLIVQTREPATDPAATEGQLEDWWAISDDGWWALGLIKRPSYH